MLDILLLLLKIIGILLLVILGIAVLLICSVLFVPVRYRVEASSDGTLEGIDAKADISWLLHLLSARFLYREGKFEWKFRIFWKKLNAEQEKESADKSLPEEKAVEEQKVERKQTESKKPEVKETKIEEPEIKETKPRKENTADKKEARKEKVKKKEQKEEKKTFREKMETVSDFIMDAVHKLALTRAKKEIIRLLRFLKPKKLKGSIHFGFEDPYRTGQVLAFLSMLYPYYGEYIGIEPDFEQKILEGNLFIKGHIRGIYAVILLWNLFFDKNVRTTYKHIRTFEF